MIASMITPMLTPMLTSMAVPTFGGGGTTTRYFTLLDSVLNNYWEFASTLVFANADSFKGEFLAPTATISSNEVITDGDNTGDPALLELDSDGTYNIGANMSVTVGGVAITSASSYPTDGKLYKYEITFTGAGRIKYLGKSESGSTSFYDGILANPVSTISGTTQTFTLGNSYEQGDIEYNAENTFGAELVEPNSTVTITSDYGIGTLPDSEPITLGSLYEYTYKLVSAPSGGTCRLRSIQGSTGAYASVGDTLSGVGISDNITVSLQGSITGDYTLELTSVREVQGNDVTRHLVPSTNIEQYTLTDGSWIGDELVTQSIWENPESYGSQWTFANNQWTLTGDGSLSALQLISTAEQELEIRVEGTASNITGDVTATANSLTEVTASYSFDTTDLQQYKRWNGSVATVTLNKPSIKHKIEVAQ